MSQNLGSLWCQWEQGCHLRTEQYRWRDWSLNGCWVKLTCTRKLPADVWMHPQSSRSENPRKFVLFQVLTERFFPQRKDFEIFLWTLWSLAGYCGRCWLVCKHLPARACRAAVKHDNVSCRTGNDVHLHSKSCALLLKPTTFKSRSFYFEGKRPQFLVCVTFLRLPTT